MSSLFLPTGRPASLHDVDNVDWVPSIGVHIDPDENTDILQEGEVQHGEQILVKHEVLDVEMLDDPSNHGLPDEDDHINDGGQHRTPLYSDNSCQTDFLSDDFFDKDLHSQIIAHNNVLREENLRLKVKVCEFSEELLSGDDMKVKFYTGFNAFVDLKYVYEIIAEKVKYNAFYFLSKFQEFLIVIIRLRLNLLEQDLAFRFGVSQGTIRNIINKWLPIMSNSLSYLIHCPERGITFETLPDCFKAAFGNKMVLVIDSLEVHVERPLVKTGTMLRNKNGSPQKFLIVMAQGSISSIYKLSSAQGPDNVIRERSIFENLMSGDIVLCGKELSLGNRVGMYQSKFSPRVYSKGQALTPSQERQAMSEQDNLMIYANNILGFVKQEFRILQSPVPSVYLDPSGVDGECLIDHILTVCCALVNFSSSVVPLKPESNGDEILLCP